MSQPQRNPRSLANLKKGGSPGRRPVAREARDWMKQCLESSEYRESARTRVLSGQAPHLERMWHEYVYGKAPDKLEVTGSEGAPLSFLEVRLPEATG